MHLQNWTIFLCLFLMQENISKANLSSLYKYFIVRFIYTQWNDSFSGNFSFSQQRNLNLLTEMILFGQQILHWKLFQISSYVTWTDGICMALTCQAAVTRPAEEPALEPSSRQADRSQEQADKHDCGIRLTTFLLSFSHSQRRSKFLRMLKEV